MTAGNREVRMGKVMVFFTDKGFGFLAENATNASGKDVVLQHFFHITDCNFEPRNGMAVQFQMGQGRKGPAAINVQRYGPAAAVAEIPGLDVLAGETSLGVK